MMRFVILLSIACVAYAEVSLQAVFQAKWSNFKAANGKKYHPKEEAARLQTFMATSLAIEKHNERFSRGLETYSMGHNRFSDMTMEEIRAYTGGMPQEPLEQMANVTLFQITPNAALKQNVDWRGWTPVVKDQGSCGSCYTFAATASLEGVHARKTGKLVNLSEQNALDCSVAYGNNGCDGGWSWKTFQAIQAYGGLYETRHYPYVGKVQQCQSREAQRQGAIKGFVGCPNEAALTHAVGTVGPVAVSIDSSLKSFMNYKGGIYSDKACGASGATSHLVAVVGYGTENGTPYYTAKNSWGDKWGEGGYMRLLRNICLIDRYGFYPVC